MAEKQSDHRMHIEKVVVDSDFRRANRGLHYGFLLAATMVGGGIYLAAFQGHLWFGSSLSILSIGTLAGVFVYGTKSRRSERESKPNPPPQ